MFSITDPTCFCGGWDYEHLDTAIIRVDSLIKSQPDNSDLYFTKGYYLRCLCENQDDCHLITNAIQCQKIAIKLNSKNHQAYEELGAIYNNPNDTIHYNIDTSFFYFNQALELNKHSGVANSGLGEFYLVKERYCDAIKYFKRAIKCKKDCSADDYIRLIVLSFKTYNFSDIDNYYANVRFSSSGSENSFVSYMYDTYVRSDKKLQDEIYAKLLSYNKKVISVEEQQTRAFLFDMLDIEYFKLKPELLKGLNN